MKKIKAFSLLEVMIVMAITGILIVSVSQGYRLLEKAKIEKTVSQISLIRSAVIGKNCSEDNDAIWKQLIDTDTLAENDKTSAIGGIFFFEDHWLYLVKNAQKEGFLTEKQSNQIKEKLTDVVTSKESNDLYFVKVQL